MEKSLETHYTKEGTGKNVLFLHGWGCEGRIFDGLSRAVARLTKEGICAVGIDFWGFGRSETPKAHFGIAEYAEETAKFIMESCEPPVVIVGHSFGGRVAVLLASEYPALVDSFVLIGGAGLRRFSLIRTVRVLRYKILKSLARRNLISRNRLAGAGSKDYISLNESMKKIFVRIVNEDLSRYAKKITARALLIYGRNDSETPMWIAKKYNRLIKHSVLKVVDNASHFAFIEKEYATARLIADFLES